MNKQSEFSPIRAFLWPIHGYEMKKFLPLFFMFLLITFNYTFLRNSKDTLILSSGGIDVLSALKAYFVIPSAFLYMGYYSTVCNKVSSDKVFYYAILPFIIFFTLFALFLYPNVEALELTSFSNFMQGYLSEPVFLRCSSVINAIRYWPFSLYYIMAELWGSAVLSLLFWGFTNQITNMAQAKRFYALLGIGANIGLTITGPYVALISNLTGHDFPLLLQCLMATFLVTTAMIVALYSWMQAVVVPDPQLVDSQSVKPKKSKVKPSFMDSIALLFSSHHLMCIAVLVFAYGVSINLIEVIWKFQVKEYYTVNGVVDKVAIQQFFANTNSATGLLTIFLMLFVSGQVERAFGWGFAALITPVAILSLGCAFFGITWWHRTGVFPDALVAIINPLYLTLIVGSMQNAISKASKYSLFDPTKEKAYLPLNNEEKTKGKGAVDVIAARFGKGAGAFIQQMLIISFGSIANSINILAFFVFAVIASWIYAVVSLSYKLKKFEHNDNKEQPSAKAANVSPIDTTAEVTAS